MHPTPTALLFITVYLISIAFCIILSRKVFAYQRDRKGFYEKTSYYIGYTLLSFVPVFNLVNPLYDYIDERKRYKERHNIPLENAMFDRFVRILLVPKVKPYIKKEEKHM